MNGVYVDVPDPCRPNTATLSDLYTKRKARKRLLKLPERCLLFSRPCLALLLLSIKIIQETIEENNTVARIIPRMALRGNFPSLFAGYWV